MNLTALPRNPWTNVYGLARSVIAFATMGTLLANPASVLFRPIAGETGSLTCSTLSQHASLFCLAGPHLNAARYLAIALLVLVVVGYRPRYTAIFHWWVSFSVWNSVRIVDGGDQTAVVLSTLMLPLALSDPRTWQWEIITERPPHTLRSLIPRMVGSAAATLIQIQVAIIYLNACISKLRVDEWTDGTAMYYWLSGNYMGLPHYLQWAFQPILNSQAVVLLTWSVLALEFLLGIALSMRPSWRMALLPVAIVFHFGIAIFMGITSFAVAMLGALLLYLPERALSLGEVLAWYTKRFRRLSASLET